MPGWNLLQREPRAITMSIVPKALLPFLDKSLDDMLGIAITLGDVRVNQRPDLPDANSPYAILTHCIGVIRYWLGSILAGHPDTRDRDEEFLAKGTVAEIREAVQALKRQMQEDILRVQGDQLLGDPIDLHGSVQEHTQGDVLLHCLRELAQHHGQMELTRDILLKR